MSYKVLILCSLLLLTGGGLAIKCYEGKAGSEVEKDCEENFICGKLVVDGENFSNYF